MKPCHHKCNFDYVNQISTRGFAGGGANTLDTRLNASTQTITSILTDCLNRLQNCIACCHQLLFCICLFSGLPTRDSWRRELSSKYPLLNREDIYCKRNYIDSIKQGDKRKAETSTSVLLLYAFQLAQEEGLKVGYRSADLAGTVSRTWLTWSARSNMLLFNLETTLPNTHNLRRAGTV